MIEPGFIFNIVMIPLCIACLFIAFGLYTIPLLFVIYFIARSLANSGEEE